MLIGFLMALILFGVFFVGLKLGSRQRKGKFEPTEEQRRKIERLQKEFNEVMNYSLSTALGRRDS